MTFSFTGEMIPIHMSPLGCALKQDQNYSLDCPDELLALLELEVDDDEESDVAELGPAFGQHTLQ